MKHRELSGENRLLRIFLGEGDKFHHKRISDQIVEAARRDGLAGCTVIAGLAGFGAGRRIHTPVDMEGSGSFAMVIELIDEANRITEFWTRVRPMLSEAGSMVTEESVMVHHYAPTGENIEKPGAIRTEGTVLLRIFLGESDKSGHEALYLEIIKRARKLGLAGCTAIRGLAGFGASSVIHESHLLRVSQDLPIVLEAVDTSDKIEAFLKDVKPLLQGALITEEKVQLRQAS